MSIGGGGSFSPAEPFPFPGRRRRRQIIFFAATVGSVRSACANNYVLLARLRGFLLSARRRISNYVAHRVAEYHFLLVASQRTWLVANS